MNTPLINWFTVGCQIINFLILVALLKHFLYGRIIKAMDDRAKTIADRLQDAERSKQEAAREQEACQSRLRELDANRETLLTKAREEADRQFQELLREGRQELDAQRGRWYEALRQETDGALQELRRQMAHGVCAVARRALADLADAGLEERIVRVFLRQLDRVDGEAASVLEALRKAGGNMTIQSSFALSPEQQQVLDRELRVHFPGTRDIRFETSPSAICGIQLITDGYRLAWEMGHYLKELEAELVRAVSNGSGKERAMSSSSPAVQNTGESRNGVAAPTR